MVGPEVGRGEVVGSDVGTAVGGEAAARIACIASTAATKKRMVITTPGSLVNEVENELLQRKKNSPERNGVSRNMAAPS